MASPATQTRLLLSERENKAFSDLALSFGGIKAGLISPGMLPGSQFGLEGVPVTISVAANANSATATLTNKNGDQMEVAYCEGKQILTFTPNGAASGQSIIVIFENMKSTVTEFDYEKGQVDLSVTFDGNTNIRGAWNPGVRESAFRTMHQMIAGMRSGNFAKTHAENSTLA